MDRLQTISGSGSFSESGNIFTFNPDFPQQGRVERYKKNGTAIQTSDGTFEFIQNDWSRSRAQLIKKLSHGRLSKTINGDYLLTIRVGEFEPRPSGIIADNAMTAMDALQEFLFREEAA
jgi:hypothetical protein